MTRHFFLTMLGKAALWFAAFNIFYLVVQPLQYPHLTLYNHLFPGRLRLAWTDQPGSYLVNETVLTRLIGDHLVARPKAEDEYRIIILGSSETWGFHILAQQTMPIVLDTLGLQTPDGRQVQVYNLSYVYADAFKDLLILKSALDMGTQPDLIIYNVNNYTFAPLLRIHWLTQSNPELALELIEQYGVEGVPRELLLDEISAGPLWRRSFIAQRSDVAAWLTNQVYGLAWATLGEDYPVPSVETGGEHPRQSLSLALTQTDALDALAQLAQENAVPLLVVETPAWVLNSEQYTDWLEERAEALQIPRLVCNNLLPPHEYMTRLHFTTAGHQYLAEQVAAWLEQYWELPSLVTACPNYDGT